MYSEIILIFHNKICGSLIGLWDISFIFIMQLQSNANNANKTIEYLCKLIVPYNLLVLNMILLPNI